jgi:VCBS repeat-containing protein
MAFDPYQYIASYGDLIQAFGDNAVAGQRHYLTNGINERRQPDAFDEDQYLANYADLRNVFGGDSEAATLHYIRYGYFEGRNDAEPLPDIFNGLQYIASHDDLIAAFGADEGAGERHYLAYGREEGRVIDHFDEKQYLANYADLAAVFNGNGGAATLHYILFGKDEGRTDAVPDNVPPLAVDDAFTVSEDADSAIVRVLANDSDPNPGDKLQIVSVTSTGILGSIDLTGAGRALYSPNGAFDGLKAGETATDQFQYTVSDGHGGTATATVTMTITGANDAPFFTSPGGDLFEVTENTAQVVQVAASDPEGDRLLYDVTGVDGAAFTFDEAGNLVFKEAPDYEAPGDENGDNSYEIEISAGDGDARTVQKITVSVADDPADNPEPEPEPEPTDPTVPTDPVDPTAPATAHLDFIV